MIGATDALRLEWETRLPASVLGLDDLEVTGPGKDFDGPVAATSTAASGWTRPAAGPPARRCCGACARANPYPGSAPWWTWPTSSGFVSRCWSDSTTWSGGEADCGSDRTCVAADPGLCGNPSADRAP